MLKALTTLSAALLLAATAAQPAWAQSCPGCGRSGPHSMHPRGGVFFGGELTPLPHIVREEDQPTKMPAPPVATVRSKGRLAENAPTEAADNLDPLGKPVSARRQIPREDAPKASIADPFSLVPPPAVPQVPAPLPNLAAPQPNAADPYGPGAGHTADAKDVDMAHERPRFYYSGSQFPYYYGRSYVSYPHYDAWNQPATDQCKNARKERRQGWWTMPASPEWIQVQHGLEPEQGPEMAAPRLGSGARRMFGGLWNR